MAHRPRPTYRDEPSIFPVNSSHARASACLMLSRRKARSLTLFVIGNAGLKKPPCRNSRKIWPEFYTLRAPDLMDSHRVAQPLGATYGVESISEKKTGPRPRPVLAVHPLPKSRRRNIPGAGQHRRTGSRVAGGGVMSGMLNASLNATLVPSPRPPSRPPRSHALHGRVPRPYRRRSEPSEKKAANGSWRLSISWTRSDARMS
jgi:hypothetical protein